MSTKNNNFKPNTKAAWIIKNCLTSSMETHQEWIKYLDGTILHADIEDAIGDTKHHRKCVEKYQRALEALESLQGDLQALKGAKDMNDREIKKLELKAKYADNAPFCPDHRDKVAGLPCRECKIEQLQAKNEKLTKQLREHGEALTALARLKQLYQIAPDMKEPNVASAAKMLVKDAEEGLRLAHNRRREEYILQLQARIKEIEHVVRYALDGSSLYNYLPTVAEELEQVLEGGVK